MGISFQQVPAKAQGTLARPNIVWIVGENLKLDLGCYGAQHVETPYLDSLAKRACGTPRSLQHHQCAHQVEVHFL